MAAMFPVIQHFVYLVKESALAAADASSEGDGGYVVGQVGCRLVG